MRRRSSRNLHPTDSAKGPEAFYDVLKTAFGAALARFEDRPEAVGALRTLAFEAFEANVEAPACRGDDDAQSAAGENVDVLVSSAHVVLRGSVQSAMMAAMPEAGLASGLHELNRTLALALDSSDAAALWAQRRDPLAQAKLAEAGQSDPSAIFGAAAR
jgi:hypothetical protein